MNEGRLFLYVSPGVVIPIMFVVLVVASLSVHTSILLNTTWFADFFQGSAAVAAAPAPVEVAPVVEAAPAPVEAAPVEAEAAAE
ncbi:MAG: light-harvesting protein [Pseudomonadota bacterium]